MASYHFTLLIDITSFVLLCVFIISIPTTHSLNTGNSPTDTPLSECESSLKMLVPCISFVQGTAYLPSLTCCSNLKEFLEGQHLSCLCQSLNDLYLNRTLVLQMPALCNLQANITCSGLTRQIPRSPSSPASQTSQSGTNSTVAASPVFTVVPESSIIGFNFPSIGRKLGAESYIAVALLTAIVFGWRI